jgi:hypothetical protein
MGVLVVGLLYLMVNIVFVSPDLSNALSAAIGDTQLINVLAYCNTLQ